MGLLLLIVIGAVSGWLATIILRIEDTRGILVNVGVGVVAALVAGVVAGSGVLLGAIGGTALLWSLASTVLALTVFNFVRRRAFG